MRGLAKVKINIAQMRDGAPPIKQRRHEAFMKRSQRSIWPVFGKIARLAKRFLWVYASGLTMPDERFGTKDEINKSQGESSDENLMRYFQLALDILHETEQCGERN
jgi:hypothetical protein